MQRMQKQAYFKPLCAHEEYFEKNRKLKTNKQTNKKTNHQTSKVWHMQISVQPTRWEMMPRHFLIGNFFFSATKENFLLFQHLFAAVQEFLQFHKHVYWLWHLGRFSRLHTERVRWLGMSAISFQYILYTHIDSGNGPQNTSHHVLLKEGASPAIYVKYWNCKPPSPHWLWQQ